MSNQSKNGDTSTYLSHTHDDTSGGRFAAIGRPSVIGTEPVPAAAYPPASAAHQTELPPEPPLGFDNPELENPAGVPLYLRQSQLTTQLTLHQVMVVQQVPPVAWCLSGLGRLLFTETKTNDASAISSSFDLSALAKRRARAATAPAAVARRCDVSVARAQAEATTN